MPKIRHIIQGFDENTMSQGDTLTVQIKKFEVEGDGTFRVTYAVVEKPQAVTQENVKHAIAQSDGPSPETLAMLMIVDKMDEFLTWMKSKS